jgi:hypothetical protein
MKYGDLIQFEALETVVQLRDANKSDSREKFVSSYVISDEMADRITGVIFPQLQFKDPRDNKGLLVVGNYGTGKSHLMAVISSIAEDISLIDSLAHEKVRDNATAIAGLFKVIRIEIGSTTRTLRDIIITELNEYLQDNGIHYQFPEAGELTNHKDAFEQMMAVFGEKFPDKGLLFVVDEMLEYLRYRDNQQLIYDLSFLREIGEVCKDLRFRFMAGVQEAIFDSSLFAFMGNEIRRVRERFETVSIVKEDIKYVVAERLLKKNVDQTNKIREHLLGFTGFYDGMNEKIEDFIDLFPVHPDFIDTFELLKVVEKREILKSLSREMRKILNQDVPQDEPGLIAFDSYWPALCEDPSFRTLPDVRAVMDCSTVLESRIDLSLPHKQYKPMALRIINGLSIHRLTTGDIYAPIGATSEELRDRLCLYESTIALMGSAESEKELQTHIETILNEIYSTVSGQFISKNQDNRQYYLDLKKSDDYDAKIEQRAAVLSPAEINNYYYRAIMEIMECDAPSYRPGFRIWPHDIIWFERKTSRSGYLFLGTPDERSTTVPTRDFYIYFLEPYTTYNFKDKKKNDEVFFSLAKKDADFEKNLRLYGGAVLQAETSSGAAKQIYQNSADKYLKQLSDWLRKNIDTALNVTYQGKTQDLAVFTSQKNIRDIVGLKDNETINHKDLIDTIAELCLEPYFKELTPEYPLFSIRLTTENRRQAAMDCLRGIASSKLTIQAQAILDALELLDNGRISTANSRYAKFILDLRQSKQAGQVINRDEIITSFDGVEYLSEKKYRLEPELAIVVIAALVYSGEVVLAIPGGQKFDAGKLLELSRMDIQNLIDFKHLEQSKEYNLPALQALFGLFNLPPGNAVLVTQGRDDIVAALQNEIEKTIQRIVQLQHETKSGIYFWGFNMLDVLNFSAEIALIDRAKTFFEGMQPYNSPGKMKNLSLAADDINEYKDISGKLNIFDTLLAFAQKNSLLVAWIKEAVSALLPTDLWTEKTETLQKEIIGSLLAITPISEATIKPFVSDTVKKMTDLKVEYIKNYADQHSKNRLNTAEEKRKNRILSDIRFITLQNLSQISILPARQVEQFRDELDKLVFCSKLTPMDLQNSPICPHCHYNPQRNGAAGAASAKLTTAENELEKMLDNWTNALLGNLDSQFVKENMDLLRPHDKALLENFTKSRLLPQPLTDDFVSALKEALSKLDKITLTAEDIRKVFLRSGGPLTPGELRSLFEEYIDSLTGGKDPLKVRIMVE